MVALTDPNRTGRAAITAAAKTIVMTFDGLLGSDLNIWWISGSFP